ncbi:MAG: glycosyltransferase family 1 protein [Paracoccaceae bacterium]
MERPICLDLTRLVSRAGAGPMTGIDRVEYAWLLHVLTLPVPVTALVRTAPGFALLDRAGMAVLAGKFARDDWGRADISGHLSRRISPARRRAESDIRRLAFARCSRVGLGRMLARHLPRISAYFNTGHSNLSDRTLGAMARAGAEIAVLVHDFIPLEYPEMQRAGTVAGFRARIDAIARHADRVIYTSAAVARAGARWLPDLPAVIAPLGVAPTPPAPVTRPARAYFVTIGTIEPRKNHALLLDIWQRLDAELGDDAPHLLILGQRGWNNAAVFARLDRAPMMGRSVFELPGLPDGDIAGLLQGARALLFPSLTEGFGLPPLEAAALGVPVICADLPVYHETLGNYPVYLPAQDSYAWQRHILALAKGAGARKQPPALPTWQDHFTRATG